MWLLSTKIDLLETKRYIAGEKNGDICVQNHRIPSNNTKIRASMRNNVKKYFILFRESRKHDDRAKEKKQFQYIR